MDQDFVSKRITELRMKIGVTEYKMSKDMGHNTSYINHITSGHTLPSLSELFYICEYLGVTPSEFFDDTMNEPILMRQAYDLMRNLSEDDLRAVVEMLKRLSAK